MLNFAPSMTVGPEMGEAPAFTDAGVKLDTQKLSYVRRTAQGPAMTLLWGMQKALHIVTLYT